MSAAVAEGLRAFTEELVRAGVSDAVACPGSRSTPLVLALRAHPGIRLRVLLDERSAGYVALGMARTTGRAAVLLGTSGTAAVNFAPAVVEASLARVPLVVLTADRPAELRDVGAPQTIDQVHLYGRHAKWYTELPLIDGAPETLAHLRSVAGRAVATALAGPAGPVHIDAPFREPLVPAGSLGAIASAPGSAENRVPFTGVVAGARRLDGVGLDVVAARLAVHERGLIVAGPADDAKLPSSLARLAASTGFPIVADPLSGLRAGAHDRSNVIARGDQLVRVGPWIDAHRPTIVIRFGAMPTSKPFTELLRATRPELFVVDGDAGWREAALVPATHVHADAVATADGLADRLTAGRPSGASGPTWVSDWLDAERIAGEAMNAWSAQLEEPFEGSPFPALARALPDGSVLWAGNSMPVRDLDGWFPSTDRSIAIRSNRGANGIDGVISTALGSAAVSAGPVALVVGDLSFLHDLGAFVAARLHDLSLTIVLVNNDGGGIFSFLAQAATDAPAVGLPARYEELFGTPHGIELGPLVQAFGFEHRLVDARTMEPILGEIVGQPGIHVLELRTDRARNVVLHREVAAIVGAALADRVSG
ncbi:MAG: 2-succinyl-5-enolpyruvyl-6-hydroxy-3-cyclohexene-1-carboxylic-acid synthase [Chloroflexota bacterium]